MSVLDKLRSLVGVKIDISRLKEIHLLSDNQVHHTVVNNTININVPSLSERGKGDLKKIIEGAVKTEGSLLLEDKAKKVLEDFNKEDKDEATRVTLDYFRGKIPLPDIEILRASLYIKTVFERGESVEDLKWGIIQRYGKRGNNIANLCTAGYFETIIKPLYEEMAAQPDFSTEKFLARYEVIVTQSTFAVFVNRRMSADELRAEVERKMELNKKYGIKTLNIHGIGAENVDKILDLVSELKDKFSQSPEIDSSQRFVTVKIWF